MLLAHFAQFLCKLGNRIQNLGYLLANPSYSKVRQGKGSAELYHLLNKKWFCPEEIAVVLDVGANEGQFIQTVFALMPEVRIFAFEPNPDCLQKLKMIERYSKQVKIFPVALGSQKSILDLKVSKFSPASSLLTSSNQLLIEFPETETQQIVSVPVERLDNLINSLEIEKGSFLLKIDVQGYELEVLAGATGIFKQTPIILCEINLALLYENQCTLDSLIAFLNQHHYRLVDIGNPIRSHQSKEILFLYLAFIRDKQNIN